MVMVCTMSCVYVECIEKAGSACEFAACMEQFAVVVIIFSVAVIRVAVIVHHCIAFSHLLFLFYYHNENHSHNVVRFCSMV